MADDQVAVLAKAGQLLEVMAQRGAQTVVQLAEATGTPRSTIYRLLSTLRAMGWVEEPRKRGHYALGLGLLHRSAQPSTRRSTGTSRCPCSARCGMRPS